MTVDLENVNRLKMHEVNSRDLRKLRSVSIGVFFGPIVNVDMTVDLENVNRLKMHEVNSRDLRKLRSVSIGVFFGPILVFIRMLSQRRGQRQVTIHGFRNEDILRPFDMDMQTVYKISFGQIYLSKPMMTESDGETATLFPKAARLRNLTYSAPLYVDVIKRFIRKGHDGEEVTGTQDFTKVFIRKVPIMLRTSYCTLYQNSEKDLTELGECPYDQGREGCLGFYESYVSFLLTRMGLLLEHICYNFQDTQMMELLRPSLEEEFEIQNQQVALDYIRKRGATVGVTREKRINMPKKVLQKEMLPHAGVGEHCETKKGYYFGYIVLNRLTYASTLSHLRRLNSPIGREGKLAKPRQAATQFAEGNDVSCRTPEGQACGLVENLALMVYIIVGSAAYPILEFLEEWGYYLSVLSSRYTQAVWQLGDWCIAVIAKTRTKVDVQWKDGTRSMGLDSHLLFPVNIVDAHDFWLDGAFDYTFGPPEAVFIMVDLKIVENSENWIESTENKFFACFGTVIGLKNGYVEVRWGTGASEFRVAPNEIFSVVEKCEGTTVSGLDSVSIFTHFTSILRHYVLDEHFGRCSNNI
ncbi:DNA-dependent RNA polymerase II [Castilleja foliolosa]|uniref:DNA-directed RNA polymerase n=1 Tax=Castilleja foliolosa TaxID=1961234 RepID=A0ABD3BCT0_9LAMI